MCARVSGEEKRKAFMMGSSVPKSPAPKPVQDKPPLESHKWVPRANNETETLLCDYCNKLGMLGIDVRSYRESLNSDKNGIMKVLPWSLKILRRKTTPPQLQISLYLPKIICSSCTNA